MTLWDLLHWYSFWALYWRGLLCSMASTEVIQYSGLDLWNGFVRHQYINVDATLTMYIILGVGTALKVVLYIYCLQFKDSDSISALAEDHINDVGSNLAAMITASIAGHVKSLWYIDPIGETPWFSFKCLSASCAEDFKTMVHFKSLSICLKPRQEHGSNLLTVSMATCIKKIIHIWHGSSNKADRHLQLIILKHKSSPSKVVCKISSQVRAHIIPDLKYSHTITLKRLHFGQVSREDSLHVYSYARWSRVSLCLYSWVWLAALTACLNYFFVYTFSCSSCFVSCSDISKRFTKLCTSSSSSACVTEAIKGSDLYLQLSNHTRLQVQYSSPWSYYIDGQSSHGSK